MAIKGIDVSKYNGAVDWTQVKSAGIKFAMIRAGMGNTAAQEDPWFRRHMDGALAAGLDVGCYWMNYYRTVEEARKEARAFLEVIAPYKGRISYPLSSDYEGDSIRYAKQCGYAPTSHTVTEQTVAFLETLEEAGWYVVCYTNQDFYKNWFIRDRMAPYDVWLADWGNNNQGFDVTPHYPCGLHQTSSNGSIAGVSGRVDINLAYKDYPTLIKELGLNGGVGNTPQPTPEPAPSEKEIDAFYRVRTQKHGWLPEVKNLEDYAGWEDSPITDVAIKVSRGSVKYRVHVMGGGWLPWVTGYNVNDSANGYAGNGKVIDAIEVYFYTPDDIRPYQKAKYRVAPVGGGYYSYQYDSETTNGQDGYAGLFGKAIGKFQLTIE